MFLFLLFILFYLQGIHFAILTWYLQGGLQLPNPSCLMTPQMLFGSFSTLRM